MSFALSDNVEDQFFCFSLLEVTFVERNYAPDYRKECFLKVQVDGGDKKTFLSDKFKNTSNVGKLLCKLVIDNHLTYKYCELPDLECAKSSMEKMGMSDTVTFKAIEFLILKLNHQPSYSFSEVVVSVSI